MTQEQWGQLQRKLLGTVGKNNYANWIEPLEFFEISEGVATFHVPTNFLGNYVAQNFGDLILHQLSEAGQVVRRVNFRVPANSTQRPAPVVAPVSSTEQPAIAGSDQVPGAPLDKRFTFDSFVVGKPNELAHAAARRVAEGGPVTFNPLFLYGGVGLGKTHLMHAIAWELQAKRPDLNVVYLSAEQFMYRFVQALRDRKMMDFKQMFRSVDVLMVDDVQFIAGKDSTQEEFFHTFNALVDGHKQIIISADRAPGEIKDLEERIKSRLQCGLVVDLHPTDYELRLGILQSKVDYYRGQYPGLRDFRWRAGISGPSDQHQCARARRRADPAFCLRQPRGPRDHDGTDAGLPGRCAARLRAQDHRSKRSSAACPSITTSACPT